MQAGTQGFRNRIDSGQLAAMFASTTPPLSTSRPQRPLRSTPRTPTPVQNAPPAPPSQGNLSSRRTNRSFNVYFYPVCALGFVLSTYLMYMYQSYRRAVRESELLDLPQNADVSSRWMDLSRNFDDEVDFSEKFMFLGRRRKNLCQQAVGNVLEVSAGTGRNLDYYNLDPIRTPRAKRIKSLVFNDLSEIMVYQAQKKFDKLQENTESIAKFRGPVRFVVGDASDKRLIARPEGGFDTIVQTMGVCSMANPVAFLKRLGELVRQPGEESTGLDMKALAEEESKRKDYGSDEGEQMDKGGKILLLEHGRSYHEFVNRFLDNNAKLHAHRYGCWNNKDIDQVIKDSGLIIESKKRYHLGTTYEYVLRPKPRPKVVVEDGEAGKPHVDAISSIGTESAVGKRQSSWWKPW
ncbi:hypothetical protein LTS15_009253 [Exophiala xenobiotica]|nr:hypothetical protein LTS15_009253 [Exophiala xenobiotica]